MAYDEYIRETFMSGNSKKAIFSGVLLVSTNAMAGFDGGRSVTFKQIADLNGIETVKAISEGFQTVHGVNIDWNTALEVSDDEEGRGWIFSTVGGHSIRVSIDEARFASPNKIDVGN